MDLKSADVQRITRLLGDIAVLKGGFTEKKRALMRGLCEIIHGDAWILTLKSQGDQASKVCFSLARSGHLFERHEKKLEHPEVLGVKTQFSASLKKKVTSFTHGLHQMLDDSRLRKTEGIAAWKDAKMGSLIISFRSCAQHSENIVGIYRHRDREFFSEREIQIAQIVLSEVPWLHVQEMSKAPAGDPADLVVGSEELMVKLSARQKLTLSLLTQGLTQKEIAEGMNLSIHTVRDYIKAVYRHLGVRSQKELMNKFRPN